MCSEVIYKVGFFYYSCLVSGMGKRQIMDECAFSDVEGCKHSLWLGEKGRLIVSWSIVPNFDKLVCSVVWNLHFLNVFFFPWVYVNIILVVLGVAGMVLKYKTARRRSEVEWVTILLLNISEPGRNGKRMADNFGLVKQNFLLGLKGSVCFHCISFSHCEGTVPHEHSRYLTLFLIHLAG